MPSTLLDMTQEILSALSGDEVNSIGDTTESLQVAQIIKRKTLDIWARTHLPEREQLIQLVPSNDPDFPVLMTVPEEVMDIEWIKYFNQETDGDVAVPGYQPVTILSIKDFVDYINNFNPDDDNVSSFIFTNSANSFPGNYTFYYKNDEQPKYCTVISNDYVIFDSFNQDIENTLQASNTMCMGQVLPQFTMEDDFIPRLTASQQALLINEAKALAFVELKQVSHPKAEQELMRQWSVVQRDKNVENMSPLDRVPNYGRK